jgi:hypothetical protein
MRVSGLETTQEISGDSLFGFFDFHDLKSEDDMTGTAFDSPHFRQGAQVHRKPSFMETGTLRHIT